MSALEHSFYVRDPIGVIQLKRFYIFGTFSENISIQPREGEREGKSDENKSINENEKGLLLICFHSMFSYCTRELLLIQARSIELGLSGEIFSHIFSTQPVK